MIREKMPSMQNGEMAALSNERNGSTFLADVVSLFKGIVLISNVLPVLTGFWLALYFTNTTFSENWSVFILTMVGSTFVMAGALVLNNWYDVDIDTVMERTKERPTVTGNFSLKAVLTLGLVLSASGLILLSFTTIEATVHAFIGWFTYVILYTMWSKRKYTLNTVIGSISGAVTPLIGWAAIAPGYHIVPIVFALLLFIWQMPHTFAIAIKKFDEYKAANVAMLPIVRGIPMTKRQMVIYVTCLIPLPFFLDSLGTTFVALATVLNAVWLVATVSGFFTKDDKKWAHMMFLFSVNYLAVIFLSAIIVTFPMFN